MAAYGLYSHIQSNKRRSIALLDRPVLPGLSPGLCGRRGRRGADRQRAARRADAPRLERCRERAAVGHRRHRRLDSHRLQVPPVDDRCADRRPRGHPGGAAAALQSPGKSLHLARHHHAEAQGGGRSGAQRLRDRHEREAIRHHGHLRPPRTARRRRARIGARPRIDPHPQRRRAHAGDRGDHRGRDLVLRRARVPADVPGRAAASDAAATARAAAPGWRSSSPSRSSRWPGCCRW